MGSAAGQAAAAAAASAAAVVKGVIGDESAAARVRALRMVIWEGEAPGHFRSRLDEPLYLIPL